MVPIGQQAPPFVAKAFHDDDFTEVSLEDLRGKWVVLFFYPADFTFVCPTELRELARAYPQLQELDVEVLSVSTDTEFVHKAWHDSSSAIKEITFPMVADPTGTICRSYGTYLAEEGMSLRGTFLIDPDGKMVVCEVHDNSIGRSVSELVRKIQAAQYVRAHGGEACPASWKPGEESLTPSIDLVGKI